MSELFGMRKIDVGSKFSPLLKVGCCSWRFDSWKGLLYETGRKYRAGDYLADYSKLFNTVEVDQWFWSLLGPEIKLPDEKVVRIYANSVGDDFEFTVKVPNSVTLTHYYARQSAKYRDFANKPNGLFLNVDLFERFLERLEPMRCKLGPLIFQFEYLNKTKMPSLRKFIDWLDEFFDKVPAGYEYAVEVRNPQYLKNEYFEFLRRRRLGLVLVEGYYMPSIAQVADNIAIDIDVFYMLRLQGPDRNQIEQKTKGLWGQIVLPKDESLNAIARVVTDNISKKIRTYVNVNNHYEGCAPLTIERLIKLLKTSK